MNDLLKKIYEGVIVYEDETIRKSRQIDHKVEKFSKQYEKCVDGKKLEELKSHFFDIAWTAEREGFYIGLCTALEIYTELAESKGL